MDKKFTIEHQYGLYLERVNLKEVDMHPVQKKQLKQAFFGAYGQCLLSMRDDVAALSEEEGVKILDAQMKEVLDFFNSEVKGKKITFEPKGTC